MRSIELSRRLDGFLKTAQEMLDEHYKKYPLSAATLKLMHGPKYIRVVREDNSGHSKVAYCFINKDTGDVLMAAGWKAPAKHARSNILDADYGLSGLTPYGARYL